jgi:hypothetical protein
MLIFTAVRITITFHYHLHKSLLLNPANYIIFFFGATARIWALAYLHETLRFTSVFYILDSRQDSLAG